MSKAHVELVEFKKDRENKTKTWTYELKDHSEITKTVLTEDLIIDRNLWGEYHAKLELDDFPQCPSKKATAIKMANWLQRLSMAIRNGLKEGVFDE